MAQTLYYYLNIMNVDFSEVKTIIAVKKRGEEDPTLQSTLGVAAFNIGDVCNPTHFAGTLELIPASSENLQMNFAKEITANSALSSSYSGVLFAFETVANELLFDGEDYNRPYGYREIIGVNRRIINSYVDNCTKYPFAGDPEIDSPCSLTNALFFDKSNSLLDL